MAGVTARQPSASVPRGSERLLSVAVSGTLAVGSVLACAVLAMGVAAWLVTGGGPATGGDGFFAWLQGLSRFEPASVIFAGLLLVTLTPVAQLAAALIAFTRLREWRYALASAGVLAILVVSFAGALALGLAQGG